MTNKRLPWRQMSSDRAQKRVNFAMLEFKPDKNQMAVRCLVSAGSTAPPEVGKLGLLETECGLSCPFSSSHRPPRACLSHWPWWKCREAGFDSAGGSAAEPPALWESKTGSGLWAGTVFPKLVTSLSKCVTVLPRTRRTCTQSPANHREPSEIKRSPFPILRKMSS